MSIRRKVILFFLIILGMFAVLTAYLLTAYERDIRKEVSLFEELLDKVELTHRVQNSFDEQLRSWQELLLNGYKDDNYHRILAGFYEADRSTRINIADLVDVLENDEIKNTARRLQAAHLEMGRRLRESIKVYNASETDAGQIAYKFSNGIEILPKRLVSETVEHLEKQLNTRVAELDELRHRRRNIVIALSVLLLVPVIAVLGWLLDKAVARPAQDASDLASIMNQAQQIAQFGTWYWEINADRHTWSNGLNKLLGYPAGSGATSAELFLSMVTQPDREKLATLLREASERTISFNIESRVVLANGEEKILELRGESLHSGRDKERRLIIIVKDTTDRVISENRLSALANYDQLTGLPNRNLFLDRLNHAMSRAEREETKLALLFIDIDNFKSINDTLGHTVGDELLIEVGKRISESIRDVDTACRLGGDEFTIIIEKYANLYQVTSVADRVLNNINKQYKLPQTEVYATASIGIACYPAHTETVDQLLMYSDAAMYMAKERGRNGYQFFTEEINENAQRRLSLEYRLREAVAEKRFELYYQPQVNLVTGRIEGAEALLRWHDNGELISPEIFVPVLEDTGMILELGEWILQSACATCKRWHELGYKNFTLAVNVSAEQFRLSNFGSIVGQYLQQYGVEPSSLELELTESSLIEKHVSESSLEELERLGVRLAIDDFGTGYSSLSYLQQLAVHLIKIDKSFIRDVNLDTQDAAITRAIVTMAHNLEIEVMAEGVETAEQLSFLRDVGCDIFQGYIIARPMPATDFERWMESQNSSGPENFYWNQCLATY